MQKASNHLLAFLSAAQPVRLETQRLFNKWDRQFALGIQRGVIQLIQCGQQGSHIPRQAIEQEPSDIHR